MKVCTACGTEYGDEVLFCQRDGTPLRPSGASADLVGQVIAERYHIQKKLGEGGMGQVYLAEHVKMGRRCAIKIMSPQTMSDPDAISRFNREAANASRIGHPNVCAIYDFGETPEGLIYLAMEFIEGRSLSGLLEELGTLPLARAASIITQCADALQVAHDLGIVHRDLKPDNIMVTTSRGKDTVKVVDFGIAKAVGADGGAQKVTKTGFVVGTPEYMSPEQLAGDPVDGRSDLYSLALVFYRMLTGGSPFPADSQQETMIKRLTDDPLPLATARPDVRFPADLQRVMDRALARSPQDRYPSAAEFARDVRALAGAVTGQVDAEAGTQQISLRGAGAAPEPGTVPATRVDPAVGRERPRAPPPAGGTERVPAAASRRRSLPLVPVAVGLVLVAALGGTLVFRNQLFPGSVADSTTKGGGGGVLPGDTSGIQPGPGKADTDKMSHLENPDSLRASGGGSGNPPPVRPNPGPTGQRIDSATKPIGTIPTQPASVSLPDQDDLFDPGKRTEARRKAIAIYFRAGVPDSVRASAALMVMVAYQQDSLFQRAADWGDSSYRIKPNDRLLTQIHVLRQQAGN
jgi:eukaryotic-like serine/threonine-protein kinase